MTTSISASLRARRATFVCATVALVLGAGAPGAQATPNIGSGLGVSDVTQTSAVIGGSVSPGSVSFYHVEFGPTTSYGSSAPNPEAEQDPYTCTLGMSVGDCIAAQVLHNQVTIPLSSLLPGTTYHVRLVAHDAGGTAYGDDVTFTTAPPGPAPVDVAPPTLKGRAMVGVDLRCEPGSWSGATMFAFAWLRNGVAIPDASDETYAPGAADAGAQIACRVTASSPGDADGTAQTPAVRIADEPLKVALLTRAASVRRDGTLRLRVSCRDVFERCRTTLTLTAAGHHGRRAPPALARAKVVLAAGADGRVTLTLNRRGRQLVADAPRRRLTVSVTLGAATHTLQLAG